MKKKNHLCMCRADVHASRLSAASAGVDGAQGSAGRWGRPLKLHRGGSLRHSRQLAAPGCSPPAGVEWHAPPLLAASDHALRSSLLPQLGHRYTSWLSSNLFCTCNTLKEPFH